MTRARNGGSLYEAHLQKTVLRSSAPRISGRSAQWLTNGTNVYYNCGKVGIGTSTPTTRLHVTETSNTGIGFFQNVYGLIAMGVDPSGGYMQADNINFSFWAGMGTTSPSSKIARERHFDPSPPETEVSARIASGLKVSWLVTGVRHDRFAEKNRVKVEVDKEPEERGYYLHPEAFDKTANEVIPSLAP